MQAQGSSTSNSNYLLDELSDTDSNSTIVDTDYVSTALHRTEECQDTSSSSNENELKFHSPNFGESSKSQLDRTLDSLVTKYSAPDYITAKLNTIITSDCIEISSDEDFPDIRISSNPPILKENVIVPSNNNNNDKVETFKKYTCIREYEELSSNDSDSESSAKKKCKLNVASKEMKTSKKAIQAEKRKEIQNQKLIKKAMAISNKNQKPDECIKFMTVLIDLELINEKFGSEILNTLQANNVKYNLQSQLVSNCITWNRTIEMPHFTDTTNKLYYTNEASETDEVLLIMNWKQIIELVHTETLIQHLQSIKNILFNKKLSLGIYGLENYFKYQKSQIRKNIQLEMDQTTQKKTNKNDKTYKDVPKVSPKQLEFVLTELQLLCGCCYRKLETPEEVAAIVMQFTKSIAQIPYKREQREKYEEAKWYMSEDSKDCVRVDKNGNGLARLWKQQLTTFPLASLEHAEAIISKYSTPLCLMKEYDKCTQSEGEKLLQDIPIRRAAGPLTTVRKIGPELSKKIYTFFTSIDKNCLI